MRIGFMHWPRAEGITVPTLARALEERGFSSLWVSEHTHMPATRRTPWPVAPGSDLPRCYMEMLDPFVALTAAAAVTTRLAIGTGICLVAQRDAIVTAKEVASLDQLSGGRMIFGVGYGWNYEELRNHGVDPRHRRAIVREKVAAMRQLWSTETASYSGEHVNLQPSWCWPKPLQEPGPPVLLGAGPSAFGELAAWADGWIGVHHDAVLSDELPLLHRRLEEAGRDPASLEVHVIHSSPSEESLDAYRAAGISGVILFPPPWLDDELESEAGVVRMLDELQPFTERYGEPGG